MTYANLEYEIDMDIWMKVGEGRRDLGQREKRQVRGEGKGRKEREGRKDRVGEEKGEEGG